jgi:Domain of unknown function (DUF4936)
VSRCEIYVYYKLPAEAAAAALAAFETTRGTAPVRLLQRQEVGDGLLTWMEIYAGLDNAEALERRLAEAMSPFTQGGRHREVFIGLVGQPGPTS